MRVIAKHVGLLVSTLVAVSAAGCGGGSADVTPVPLIQTVARLSVSPTALDMVVGASATLSARTYDASGAELTGRLLTWSSSDISKLTVSTSGLVTAVATGTFTVTASAEGKSASASVRVEQPQVGTVNVTPATSNIFIGQTTQLTVSVRDVSGQPVTGEVTRWSSSDSSRATVSSNGLVTARGEGLVTISAVVGSKNGRASLGILPIATTGTQVSPVQVDTTEVRGATHVFSPLSVAVVGASGGSATVVSSTLPQLVLAVDSSNTLRGLSIANDGSASNIRIDATTTAISLVMLAPGVVKTDVVTLAETVRQVRALPCIVDLTQSLRAALVANSLVVAARLPNVLAIRRSCFNESSGALKKRDTRSASQLFPVVGAETVVPQGSSGRFAVRVVENGLASRVELENGNFSRANVYSREVFSRGAQSSKLEIELMNGATGLSFGSIFTLSAFSPKIANSTAASSSPATTIEYWFVGGGWRASQSTPPSGISVNPLIPTLYGLWDYGVSGLLELVGVNIPEGVLKDVIDAAGTGLEAAELVQAMGGADQTAQVAAAINTSVAVANVAIGAYCASLVAGNVTAPLACALNAAVIAIESVMSIADLTRWVSTLATTPRVVSISSQNLIGPRNVLVAAGSSQRAAPNLPLAPISLQVQNAFGKPVPNVPITLQVVSGGGSLGATSGVSDPTSGSVTVQWRLGQQLGSQSISAKIVGSDITPLIVTAFAENAVQVEPIPSTQAATAMTSTSFQMNGTVNPQGLTPVINLFQAFTGATCAGTATGYPLSDLVSGGTTALTRAQVFNSALPNATYSYRMVASRETGIPISGNCVSVTTSPATLVAMSLTPTALAIVPNNSEATTVTLTRTNYSGNVTLSVPTSLPAGLSATITQPGTGNIGIVQFNLGSSYANFSNLTVTIRASGTGITSVDQTITLNVGTGASIALVLAPTSLALTPGSFGTTNATLIRSNFTGTVSLSVPTTLPAGVTSTITQPGTGTSGSARFNLATSYANFSNLQVTIRASGIGIASIDQTVALSSPSNTALIVVGRGSGTTGTGQVNWATSRVCSVTSGGTAGNCSGDFTVGSVITFTAVPNVGSTFGGWGGSCAGAGLNTTCQLGMNFAGAAYDPSASFVLNTAASCPATLPAGVVAYYPLDGNGKDCSANANDGSLVGSPTATVGRNGLATTATSFGGSSYVSAPSITAIRNLTSEMTLVFWVKKGSSNITDGMLPVARREPGNRIHFLAYSGAGGFAFQCCSSGGSATGSFFAPGGTGLTTINNGSWHQIAMVRKFGAGGYTHLYLDGTLLSGSYLAGSATDVPALIDAALLIGRQASTSPGQFVGLLDDVIIFNRVLTQSEIVGIP